MNENASTYADFIYNKYYQKSVNSILATSYLILQNQISGSI